MVKSIFLVRHGQAGAGWGDSLDPGLSDKGLEQAHWVKDDFAPHDPKPLISSPLRRARETAQPLAEAWQAEVAIDPAFIEIPAPSGYSLQQRLQWLLEVRSTHWGHAGAELTQWRQNLLQRLEALPGGAIVFTHFMVMNTVVGASIGNDALVCYQPDNGSVLHINIESKGINIVDRGRESETRVL